MRMLLASLSHSTSDVTALLQYRRVRHHMKGAIQAGHSNTLGEMKKTTGFLLLQRHAGVKIPMARAVFLQKGIQGCQCCGEIWQKLGIEID